MPNKLQIFKCNKCGNIIEVLHGGAGALVCCGENMSLFEEKEADKTTEKHVPIVEKLGDGHFKVTVGSTLHPMEEKHWIEWIEVSGNGNVFKKYLQPGDEPVAEFKIDAEYIIAREFCNVHGLWKDKCC